MGARMLKHAKLMAVIGAAVAMIASGVVVGLGALERDEPLGASAEALTETLCPLIGAAFDEGGRLALEPAYIERLGARTIVVSSSTTELVGAFRPPREAMILAPIAARYREEPSAGAGDRALRRMAGLFFATDRAVAAVDVAQAVRACVRAAAPSVSQMNLTSDAISAAFSFDGRGAPAVHSADAIPCAVTIVDFAAMAMGSAEMERRARRQLAELAPRGAWTSAARERWGWVYGVAFLCGASSDPARR